MERHGALVGESNHLNAVDLTSPESAKLSYLILKLVMSLSLYGARGHDEG